MCARRVRCVREEDQAGRVQGSWVLKKKLALIDSEGEDPTVDDFYFSPFARWKGSANASPTVEERGVLRARVNHLDLSKRRRKERVVRWGQTQSLPTRCGGCAARPQKNSSCPPTDEEQEVDSATPREQNCYPRRARGIVRPRGPRMSRPFERTCVFTALVKTPTGAAVCDGGGLRVICRPATCSSGRPEASAT